MNPKKSFTLFSTLILVFIFSILTIKILEVNSLNSQNTINQYKYIQAKNHINFLEEYIKSLKDLETINKIKVVNKKYEIYANLKKEQNSYKVNLYCKAIGFNVRIHKSLEIIR